MVWSLRNLPSHHTINIVQVSLDLFAPCPSRQNSRKLRCHLRRPVMAMDTPGAWLQRTSKHCWFIFMQVARENGNHARTSTGTGTLSGILGETAARDMVSYLHTSTICDIKCNWILAFNELHQLSRNLLLPSVGIAVAACLSLNPIFTKHLLFFQAENTTHVVPENFPRSYTSTSEGHIYCFL